MRHFLFCFFVVVSSLRAAIPVDIEGPAGSGAFGTFAVVLPNGNVVVTDPLFDRQIPVVADVGAVYLYRPDGTLVSRITGTSAGDQVGSGGVVVLGSGHFVVQSPLWDNAGTVDAGALSFGNADTGFDVGVLENVTSANSLVGTHTNDMVGGSRPYPLPNGHYVALTSRWDNGAATDAGAVTWGDGWEGVSGAVSAGNSLVGSTTNDRVGIVGMQALSSGNYVVPVEGWDDGPTVDVGAVVLCRGSASTVGTITSANALIGSTAGDSVGSGGIWILKNGNFVVSSPEWDNGTAVNAGAATLVDGVLGLVGNVSDSNSLVGSATDDYISTDGILSLANGHYAVFSSVWDGAAVDVGAVTWGDGFAGVTGPVSAANSIVGSTASDQIGQARGTALSNGHYVINSPSWDNGGIVNAGAVTWANGNGPTTSVVSTANSLHGTTNSDEVGSYQVLGLNNGNYIVPSPIWDNGSAVDAGAVTWCNGSKGLSGPVSSANSLVGTTSFDRIGSQSTNLINGNYVVSSESWDNGSVVDAGAVTWGSGTKGVKGPVSKSNSLVGTSDQDGVGQAIYALRNGNYVTLSTKWHNGSPNNVGAVTWGNGMSGVKGAVSAANSLIGERDSDFDNPRVTPLSGGHYVVVSETWNDGRGSVTWCDGTAATKGVVSATNSLIGNLTTDELGSGGVVPLANGNYSVNSPSVSQLGVSEVGAVTLGNGVSGTVGLVSPQNSVFGQTALGGLSVRSARSANVSSQTLVVTRQLENIITLFGTHFPRSLARTTAAAPGAQDIAYSALGSAAVSAAGSALFDGTLTGAGSKAGKNKGVFATPWYDAPIDMVLQSGAVVGGYDDVREINATATGFSSLLNLQYGRGVFQGTLSGSGITSSNNKTILVDSGAYVMPIFQTGQPTPGLGSAKVSTIRELLQAERTDMLVLSYTLATSTGVNSSNDSGILILSHGGGINPNATIAREGSAAFGGGTLGQLSGKAAAGQDVIHFTSSFKPSSGSTADAIFRFDSDGTSASRVALVGESPPDITGDSDAATVKFSSFPALSKHTGLSSDDALFKAILKSGDSARNEGIWRLPNTDTPTDQRLARKGDQVTGLPTGVVFSSFTRFWPADRDQVIIQAKISGPGVSSSNNQVLALRQADGNFLVLMRTGDSPDGIGTAKITTFSAVEVEPDNGIYVVLTSLSGAPTNANQVLWIGATGAGADSPADKQALRLPQVRLRKGERYSSPQTTSAVIKSISMKPFTDSTGAGGRGLSRCISSVGSIAVHLLTDRNTTELVLLPPLFAAD
ncbi:MAG: hypothetical protein JNJ83_09640 [Verrucomicrobiaceae bacterium]|nr:hypothetical protein [Verrucomicrobiaceae bacterium]